MTLSVIASPPCPGNPAHGLPRHYVPRNDGFICVTASEARQSMQLEVMDCFTSFAMTVLFPSLTRLAMTALLVWGSNSP